MIYLTENLTIIKMLKVVEEQYINKVAILFFEEYQTEILKPKHHNWTEKFARSSK